MSGIDDGGGGCCSGDIADASSVDGGGGGGGVCCNGIMDASGAVLFRSKDGDEDEEGKISELLEKSDEKGLSIWFSYGGDDAGICVDCFDCANSAVCPDIDSGST